MRRTIIKKTFMCLSSILIMKLKFISIIKTLYSIKYKKIKISILNLTLFEKKTETKYITKQQVLKDQLLHTETGSKQYELFFLLFKYQNLVVKTIHFKFNILYVVVPSSSLKVKTSNVLVMFLFVKLFDQLDKGISSNKYLSYILPGKSTLTNIEPELVLKVHLVERILFIEFLNNLETSLSILINEIHCDV